MPVAVSVKVIENVAVDLRRAEARTYTGEVHQEGEGNHPVIHGIDNIATIKLEVRGTLGAKKTEVKQNLPGAHLLAMYSRGTEYWEQY